MERKHSKGMGRAVRSSIALLLFLLAGACFAGADWNTFHYNSYNAGFVPLTFTGDVGVSTITSASGAITTAIIVNEGIAYFGSNDNKMYAINVSSGEMMWTPYSTSDDIKGSAAFSGTYLIFGSRDNKVYALNNTDGSLIWDYTTGGDVWSSPKIDNETVFIGSDDMYLYALNISDGSVLWSYPTDGRIRTAPAVINNTVFTATEQGTIYALNKTNGNLSWNYELNSTVYSSPAVEEGQVYVGSYDGVYALSYSDLGNFTWSYDLDWNYATTAAIVYSSPAIDNTHLYIGDSSGKIYKITKSTGSLVWSYGTNGAIDSSPTVTSNALIIGSKDNSIYTINTSSGSLIRKVTVGNDVDSSPAIYGNHAFIGSSDFNLYKIGPPEQTPVISNLQTSSISDTSVVITFITNVSTNTTIHYGYVPYSYFLIATDSTFFTAHSLTLSSLIAERTIYYRLTVTDEQNRTTISSQYTFSTLDDQTPPSITIISPANNSDLPAATTEIPVFIQTDKNASCKYDLYDPTFDFNDGSNMTQVSSTSYMFTYSNGSSFEGTIFNFYYRCSNNNGNISDAIEHTLTVIQNDGVAPVISILSPTNFVTNNLTADFNMTSNENLSTAVVVIDGQNYPLENVSGNLSKWMYSDTFEYGNYSFYFTATDPDGNSVTSDTYWFFINYTDPIVVESPLGTVEAPAFELLVTTRTAADCYYNLEQEINLTLENMEYDTLMNDHYNNTFIWQSTEHKELLITQSRTNYINIKCVYNRSDNTDEIYYTRISYYGILDLESDSIQLEDASLGMNDKLIYHDANNEIGFTVNYEVLVDLALVVNKNIRPFTFRVHESNKLPGSIFKEAPGKVYRYLEVNRSAISNDDIKRGMMHFKVRKSWMEANKLNASNITLMKYQDNRWIEMPTTVYRETDLYHYFSSNFTSLSVFAVTTKPVKAKPPVTIIVTGRNVTGRESEGEYSDILGPLDDFLDSFGNMAWLPLVAGGILLIAIIVAVVLLFTKDLFGIRTNIERKMARRKIDSELNRKMKILQKAERTHQKEGMNGKAADTREELEESVGSKAVRKEAMQYIVQEMIDEQRLIMEGKKGPEDTEPERAPLFGWIVNRFHYYFGKDKEMIRLRQLQRRIRQVKYETSRRDEPLQKGRWTTIKSMLAPKRKDAPDRNIHESLNRIEENFRKIEHLPHHHPQDINETVKIQWKK